MAGEKKSAREELKATIDRAGFESLLPEMIRIQVTDSLRRRLGDCRPIAPSDSDSTAEYEIRIVSRLFEAENDDLWRDTVRHEVAHAHVFETTDGNAQPHGAVWKAAARRAGTAPVARYEGDDVVDAEYLLACQNGCFERGYVQRAKRIKNPWLYTCPDCTTSLLSCDAHTDITDLEPGVCHVDSIPWEEPRFVHACPNNCFSLGYGHQCEEIRQPERYSCGDCGARTVAYPAGDRPPTLEAGTRYIEQSTNR